MSTSNMDSECTLHSTLEEKNASFNWTIENWHLVADAEGKFEPKTINLIDSAIKCDVNLNCTQWKVSVLVQTDQSSTALLQSKISMALVNQQKSIIILEEDAITKQKYSERCIYHFKLPEKHEVQEFIGSNDSLTFRCTLHWIWDKSVLRYNLNTAKKLNDSSYNLDFENHLYRKKLTLTNYGSLYEKKQLCDVTIVTTEGELKAHSVILAIVSPYFLAMFSHKDLKESTEHIVDLTKDSDVTLEVYRGFLDYVYGLKTVGDMKNIVMELLVLADKYDVQELKRACEHYLCDDLDHDNLPKLLHFSHKYNCEHLLQQALDLARTDNMDIIKESSEFDEIYQNKELMLLLL